MSFPLGNALIFQGFSLIVNKYFGAEILVLYNTTRTLTSFLTQMLGAILQAVWPEFSIAYGKKDIQRMRELHRKAFVVATSAAIFISIFLLIFGNYIYSLWTQGKVEFDFSLMLAFLIVLIFRNIWSTSSVALMATNKHSKMGLLYVFFSVLSIGVAITLAIFYPSITLNVYCLLIIEIGLCIYTLKRAMELTEDNFGDLVSSFKYIFIDYKEIFKRKFIKTI
jgi:O-antigen/teichoic acid export membrane protein